MASLEETFFNIGHLMKSWEKVRAKLLYNYSVNKVAN